MQFQALHLLYTCPVDVFVFINVSAMDSPLGGPEVSYIYLHDFCHTNKQSLDLDLKQSLCQYIDILTYKLFF